MIVDRRELLRYLGWRGQDIDTGTQKAIDEACDLCLAAARPMHTAALFDYDSDSLVGTGFSPGGASLAAYFAQSLFSTGTVFTLPLAMALMAVRREEG